MPRWAACGQDNPDGFRFCGACGSPLAVAPAAVGEERKVVTVVFCDLVGFTARAETLDPGAELAVALVALGRGSEVVELSERAAARASAPRWLGAARLYGVGDFAGAADEYARIGSLPYEADARLRAARELVHAGRRTEADAQLRPALAFYRRVGATRYLREGEALFAATA